MNAGAVFRRLEFKLPPELEAGEPPEARGMGRDDVRLMVSSIAEGQIKHARFPDLSSFLQQGDVLVINTSRTRNSAVRALRADCTELELHLSAHLEGDFWTAEVRALNGDGKSRHFEGVVAGEHLMLTGHARASLVRPFVSDCETEQASPTLWEVALHLPMPVDEYLARHAFPIRYNYVNGRWPLSYYQTVYATETGSAEMPSAGRPFTIELLTQLQSQGVRVTPLILHAGVSNAERNEPPYKEFYRIPLETAQAVNHAHKSGGRVVAVGTTVVRALESVTNADGAVHAGEGLTCLIIGPEARLRAVNALLTGLHEPEASHLAILEALAGGDRIQEAYAAALQRRYLWHEFGDLHLLLP